MAKNGRLNEDLSKFKKRNTYPSGEFYVYTWPSLNYRGPWFTFEYLISIKVR